MRSARRGPGAGCRFGGAGSPNRSEATTVPPTLRVTGTSRRPPRWWLVVLWGTTVSVVGCGDGTVEPTLDPGTNFEVLWGDFDRLYSFFVVKDVDWDDSYQRFRPRITSTTAPRDLFDTLSEMLLELEDGHVRLETPLGRSHYTGWFDRFPPNFDSALVARRLDAPLRASASGRIRYGTLTPDIGYVHVPSFGGTGWADDIDAVLTDLAGVTALVFDVRDNTGGNDLNGRAIAGRFADRERLFRRVQFREGENHSDFTELIDDFVSPAGDVHFPHPVALLTNRRVFSSAESFVLAMRVLPNVITAGDTTGGGSANPEERDLPNGWTFFVSRWLVWTPEGTTFEGVGLSPEFPVWITDEDAAQGVDTILELAIAELERRR